MGSLLLFYSCSTRSTEPENPVNGQRLVDRQGSESTFDIATWNIREFPLNGETTITTIVQLIRDLDIDMFGFQELNDESAFFRIVDSLENYDGFISELPGDILKLGIMYKRDIIAVTVPSQIYTSDWYAFPRPPLITYVEVKKEGEVIFNFSLIVNHLKAFGDDESVDRRREACLKLKEYIDSQILNSADPDLVMLGDFNDRLNDPADRNVFNPFLQDPMQNYIFLTAPLADQATYIGDNANVIDHILISKNTLEEYQGGSTVILKLEVEFEAYTTVISDHRPVLSRFPVF